MIPMFFCHRELRHGDKVIGRGRPPLSGKPKTAITLRLDEDVVDAYREAGEGWQTRIYADLRASSVSACSIAAHRQACACRRSRQGASDESIGGHRDMLRWYSWVGSNHRPPVPQTGALTN
jgi:BrnA antitoxin of type II toxin-antitoxin system